MLVLRQEAGQKLDVRVVVYTGNVSFSRLAGRAGAGLYSRIHQQQTVGAGGFIAFPRAAHPNPRAEGHESLSPLHFPAIHPAYYLGREPDKERQNMKERKDQRDSSSASRWNRG